MAATEPRPPLAGIHLRHGPRHGQRRTLGAMRGDRVEIVVDVGDGVRTFDIVAARAGRRVDVNVGRTTVEVVEVTRSGQPVRTARFLASRIVAIVEHPASDGDPDEDGPSRRAGRRRGVPENQASLEGLT
jgi:hypothetical protein